MKIQALTVAQRGQFQQHFERHRAESGRGDAHFMPFEPDDPVGPKGLDEDCLALPLHALGWQRWFVACEEEGPGIVGHVNLKGDGLKVGLHRCELGVGIEGPFRGRGLGRELMAVAIDFAQRASALAWIDIRAFAHNTNALALYRKLGFVEIGRIEDRFRIGDVEVDDVIMALNVLSE